MGATQGGPPAADSAGPGLSPTLVSVEPDSTTSDGILVGDAVLAAPCPVDPAHHGRLDLAERTFSCADCRRVVLDLAAYHVVLDYRHRAVEREHELEELLVGLDLRDRASRARALRMEELYLAGLAEVGS